MKILTAIGKGAGAILPILLVVSLGLELYDRFTERHHKSSSTLLGKATLLLSELSRLGRSTLQENDAVNPIASILITVLAEMSNIERNGIAYRLASGKQQYVQNGGKLGRHTGYRISEQELREKYPKEIALLKKGYSVRAVAELRGISKTTVLKIKKLFINKKNENLLHRLL